MNFDLSRGTKLFLDEPIVLVRLHTFDCGTVAPCDDYAVASAGTETPSFSQNWPEMGQNSDNSPEFGSCSVKIF